MNYASYIYTRIYIFCREMTQFIYVHSSCLRSSFTYIYVPGLHWKGVLYYMLCRTDIARFISHKSNGSRSICALMYSRCCTVQVTASLTPVVETWCSEVLLCTLNHCQAYHSDKLHRAPAIYALVADITDYYCTTLYSRRIPR